MKETKMNHSSYSDNEKRELSEKILTALSDICYGSVEIIIHDSKVVQIERKEKIRFDQGRSSGKSNK
jgi:hypothetical protein